GGRRVEADEVGEEIADMLEGNGEQVLFDRRERIMISGVLNLAERPIRTVMTVRSEVDVIDLAQPADAITRALINSPYSRLPLIRNGRVDE
ncbi:hypothetical protein R1N68_28770, partial [Klebsiella sp. 72742]